MICCHANQVGLPLNLGSSAVHPSTSVAHVGRSQTCELGADREQAPRWPRHLSPGPRLSCGCTVVGPFTINRIINSPVFHLLGEVCDVWFWSISEADWCPLMKVKATQEGRRACLVRGPCP